ncbi:MAG: hypothetical protein ACKVQR_11720 [Aquabacterium sp.]
MARPFTSQALHDVIQGSEPLQRLQLRMAQSRQRLAVLLPLMPPPLPEHVRAGPLDDKSYTLLADNASVAAKLRQLLPRLAQALEDAGMGGTAIRVKVLPR